MTLLLATVGMPRSGKSTWASRAMRLGAAVVCPDSFRLALLPGGCRFHAPSEPTVWAAVWLACRGLTVSGQLVVVLDSCAITAETREGVVRNASVADLTRVAFVDFRSVGEAECLRRAAASDRPDLEAVIRRMGLQAGTETDRGTQAEPRGARWLTPDEALTLVKEATG